MTKFFKNIGNQGFGLNEVLIGCSILAMALIVSVALINENFKDLEPVFSNVTQSYTYKEMEQKMVEAATKYAEEESISNGGVKITTQTLQRKSYLPRLLDPKDVNVECTGYVIYIKNNNQYTFEPYIKCEDSYQTEGYR